MTITNRHGIRTLDAHAKVRALAAYVRPEPSELDRAADAVVRKAKAAVHGRFNRKARLELAAATRWLWELERRGGE